MAVTALWMNADKQTSIGTSTISAATDFLTITAHGLSNFDEVRVDTLSGGAVGVLVEGAPYYVRSATVNTFQVAPSMGAPVMLFASDGGAVVYRSIPVYDAQALRNVDSGLYARGDVSGGHKARPGVLPNGNEDAHVTVSGTNWNVIDLVAVVNASGGPYRVAVGAESNSLNPADGTNPRIDALDLQVQDDDADGSGQLRGRIVYVAGTPAASPTAPTQTSNSERLATILVPAGGSPAPSIATGPRFTVSRGGINPVRNSSSRPGTGGLYKGMTLYDIAAKRLDANTNAGGTWEGLASTAGFTLLTGLMARNFAHTAAEVTHTSDTLTALSGGPVVTITIPAGVTNVLVLWGGVVEFTDGTETPLARWRIEMSGANTGTVGGTSTLFAVRQGTGSAGSNYQSAHPFHMQTGLSAGSTTFTSEYAITTGSAKFRYRSLFVLPWS